MDYEKILESLKICSEVGTSCEGCSGRGERHCIANLTKAAAIAIETLLHTLDMAQRERDVVTKRMIELEHETVTKCNDLFDEDGGDIYPENDSICASTNLPCCRCNPGPCGHRLEPVTERHELNEPLTLGELRKMYDGEEGTVWVKNGRACFPAILDIYDGELVAVWSAKPDYFEERHYGKTWLAYRRKPEEGTV